MEKGKTLMGKEEGKVMMKRAQNGQKLQQRNEKPVNGKKMKNAGNGTSLHQDREAKKKYNGYGGKNTVGGISCHHG